MKPAEAGYYEPPTNGRAADVSLSRLSPQQQKSVVDERRRRGLPLHRPPHFDGEASCYLITAATYEHRAHFAVPAELTALERRLLETVTSAGLEPAAWVVLPNHYHLVIATGDLPRLGHVLGAVHGRSARYANRRDGTPGRKVWCRFSDRVVRSERHLATCLHYLFMNPVKHAYVRDPLDWACSSLHPFIREHGSGRFEQLRRDYPLLDFGRGWDD